MKFAEKKILMLSVDRATVQQTVERFNYKFMKRMVKFEIYIKRKSTKSCKDRGSTMIQAADFVAESYALKSEFKYTLELIEELQDIIDFKKLACIIV